MSLPVHTVRRATINDLAALRAIWREERFAVGELERRFTEFQVIEASDGQVIGALALQIQGNQGHIHSEAIALPEHTEAMREVLWDRLKKVSGNHGLVRLWTSAAHSHWTNADFRAPSEVEQGKRPSQFGNVLEGWLVLQLKEESAQAISLEQELAIFREAQKAESLAFHQQANKIKLFATFIAFLVLILVIIGGYYVVQYYKHPEKFKKSEPIPSGSEAPATAPAPTNLPLPKPAQIPPPQANTEVKAPQ
jgi:N-acetylglutamate synthase-like GNAT family acetyltransferase